MDATPMKKLPSFAQTLAFVSLAALLAGCKTTSNQGEITASVPSDYRLRHPIAVREKVQSMTVFIGDARGALTPTQRAEVGALASSWRHEATGGIVIEMPVGSPNERAAASASREIRSILGAAGVPGVVGVTGALVRSRHVGGASHGPLHARQCPGRL